MFKRFIKMFWVLAVSAPLAGCTISKPLSSISLNPFKKPEASEDAGGGTRALGNAARDAPQVATGSLAPGKIEASALQDVAPDKSGSAPKQGGAIPGLYKASHALIIGNDAYAGGKNGWQKLEKAVSDAKAVKAALEHHGFTVTYLENLRSAEFKREMREFFIRNGSQQDARIFVWFAGHGHTTHGEGYLVPVDAPHPENDIEFRLNAISMREVSGWMREARSKHILAVFDSCFSGTIFRSARNMQAPSAAILHYAQNPIRQIITAGSAKQEVQDDGQFQKLFVRAIMGLEPQADQTGDGFVTGQELAAFLRLRITERNGARQSPQYGEISENDTERGDFVFQVGRSASASSHGSGVPVQQASLETVPRRAAALPNFDARRVFIAPVLGAPGDGNQALRAAMKERLGKEGIEVWDADSDGAFKVQTVVSVRNISLLVDEVSIQWRLLDKNRGQLATFNQVSEVLVGSRNKDWGSAAASSADFATGRLLKMLAAN